ncbi:MAG: PEP-CTERM sorting domain-containing protein [Planctomycetales bacterium]|nr:PEP-CTERM sorting domain-containing protein [Planctomycetales bacterium]
MNLATKKSTLSAAMLGCLLISHGAHASIVVDAVNGWHNNNGQTTNTTLTVGNNPDRILIVAFASAGKTTDPQPTVVEFANQPMTLLATTPDPYFATRMRSSLYYLLNPPVGTYAAYIQTDIPGPITVQAMSLYGVEQTAPTITGSTAWVDNTSSIATNVSTADDDSILVSVATIGGGSPFLVPGAGVTQHNLQHANGPSTFDEVRAYFGTKLAPTAGSQSVSWSMNTGTNYQGTQTVVALSPAGAGIPEPISLSLMGTGALCLGALRRRRR